MSEGSTSPAAELLEHDHRRLDDLFGRFLSARRREAAADAIAEFDAALRRHTKLEEEHLFPAPPPAGKLAPSPDESERERLFRELRLEHVQIRELAAMIVRLLSGEGAETAARARGLAANLARRWDAHTVREENEAFPLLAELMDPAGEAAIREALESG